MWNIHFLQIKKTYILTNFWLAQFLGKLETILKNYKCFAAI